jgi:hypothetical protein
MCEDVKMMLLFTLLPCWFNVMHDVALLLLLLMLGQKLIARLATSAFFNYMSSFTNKTNSDIWQDNYRSTSSG